MAQLPNGWVETKVDQIAEIVSGGTPKSSNPDFFSEDHDNAIAWITPADLSGYAHRYISHGKRSITDDGYNSCSAKKLPKGSVLFSSRAPIGYVAIAENEMATNQGFKSFVPEEGIDSTFLYFYLKSIRLLAERLATGTTFKEISGKVTKTLPIPLPPEPEQTRIVEKLDEVLAQVDTIKARLDGIPNILKRFRQSVLASAVSGRLTEEWRVRKNLSGEWTLYSMEQISKEDKYSLGIGPFGSNLKVSDYQDSGHPLVFVRDIRAELFGGEKTNYISSEKFLELKAHRAKPGDLLITKMGDPPGDVAIYPESSPEAVITADCIKMTVNPLVAQTKFIYYMAKSESFRKKIYEISAGVAQQKVNLKKFKTVSLYIPCLEEQTEIVRLVDRLFAFADSIEAQVDKARARVDKLTQSLLAKAFRGELVPQDPNDEPADKLLERIQVARQEAEALAKAAKKAANAKKRAAKA